jgi:hypothetical protein
MNRCNLQKCFALFDCEFLTEANAQIGLESNVESRKPKKNPHHKRHGFNYVAQ